MAYLRRIATVCNHQGCLKVATVELFSTENYSVGKYCTKHGDLKLRELNKAEGL